MGDSVRLDNDPRENPEFMQLRVELTDVLPKRLYEIDRVLGSCRIIEEVIDFVENRVTIGCKVVIQYEDGLTIPYIILGYDETDIDNDVISYLSPIAQGLLGKSPNDVLEIIVPSRKIKVKILSVERGI
jgi:transcription elongation GreA/GreB family factor